MNYERIYEYRFQGVDQNKRLMVWECISKFIYNSMGKPEKVLDPCAGRCEFVNSIQAKEIWAVDQADFILDYKNDNIQAVVGDIMEVDLPENYFGGVFVSNFLEHLSSSEHVSIFLKKMHSTLTKNGKLIIMGPNFKYCVKKYFDCSDHKLILTHIAVEEFLFSENYKIKSTYGKFLPFSFRGLFPPSPMLTRLYLRYPLFWKILGKQFLVIAEKA
jgi:ubiquinone/menaquinone biosynthesis C-methylase UbiE